MDAQAWQRIKSLFEQAIELSPEARAPFLDRNCSDEPEVRGEVEAMLAADATARFADGAVLAAAPDLVDALVANEEKKAENAWAGQRLGSWRLLREIGRGGMGAVYLAERDDGEYRQQAAIKLMRPSWDSADLLNRFRAERQILASLNHANIARLLDGGMSADGKPYLVLEYVEGSNIVEYCDVRRLGLNARLALFLDVCGAVAHAHRSLVVHRDLKPSNILIDATGQVKLLDFGIAKLIQSDGSHSQSTARVFTPEYAAPEQVRGDAVTTGVDVYALGLLLFQLLTGRRPYGHTASTPAAYEQAILTQEPQRPSTAAASADADNVSLAAARKLDPAALSAHLRGDLDAIVLRALRKEPDQRYATVAGFADDIERYLSRRPVSARRGNRRYRAWRFLQRHALSAGLAALAVLALAAGLGVSLWQAREARLQRDLATAQAQRAEELSGFLVGVFSHADPSQREGEAVSAKTLLDIAVIRIKEELGSEPDTRLALMRAMAQSYFGLGLPKEALALSEEIVTLGRPRQPYPEWGADLILYAGALRETSQAALAEPVVLEALAWIKAQTPVDTKLLLRVLHLQAMVSYALQRRDESLQQFQALLAILEADPKLDPDRFDDVRTMVSRQLATKGDFVAAEKLALGVVADIEAAVPLRELDLITALDAVGSLYDKMGRRPERVAIYRRILPIATRRLGADHFDTGIVYHNLGQALEDSGEHAEALQHAETAVRIGVATVGAEHAFTTAARLGRARLRCRVIGAAAVDAAEHAHLVKITAEKFPHYQDRLAETRAVCGL